MKYTRKNNKVAPFFWFIISILFLESLFVAVTISLINVISLLKNGIISVNFKQIGALIGSGNCYIIWIALPLFIGYSISLLKSAVTEISFNQEKRIITIVYHSAISLFLIKKTETIDYNLLEYEVETTDCKFFNIILFPLLPQKGIIFYKNGKYLLQFGCTIGWSINQINEIEVQLKKIRHPGFIKEKP